MFLVCIALFPYICFALVSADKSENNVIAICRRYYVKRHREELEGRPEAAEPCEDDEGGGENGKDEIGEKMAEGKGEEGEKRTYREEKRNEQEIVKEMI
jgi:hypothetical protein